MARGDSNLLFDPPKIRKSTQEKTFIIVGQEKKSVYPIKEMAFMAEGPAIVTDGAGEGRRLFRSENYRGRNITHEIRVGSSEPYFFSEKGFLWFEKGEVILESSKGDKKVIPWNLPGEIRELYLSHSHIYALWLEDQELRLSMTPLSVPQWIYLYSYPQEDIIHLEQRDQQSFLVCDSDDNFLSLMNLDKGSVRCPPDKVAKALRRDLYKSTNENELKITPGNKNGQYHYLDFGQDNQIELCFLDFENNEHKTVANLSQFLDQEEQEDLLNHWSNVKIRGDKDALLIFFPGKLIVSRENGPLEKVNLSRQYNQIAVTRENGQSKALLWSSDGRVYQTITILDR